MASDIKTTGVDADMAECDGEKVVTMMDVLQEQEEFEEDANAVLGASDDKNCTYSKGYIKRQAIYACLTCCPEAKSDATKRAGACLACSLMCHENHELIELYTKRNFRCDCGNPKFNSHPCTFTSDKTDLNEDNYYNQNFSGLYCTCQRPYPDPETTEEDEMIQCIICEDWLHASHLQSTVPANEQYSEMICKNCMEKNEFLYDYSDLAVNTESIEVDIVTVNGVESNNPQLSDGDVTTEKPTDASINDKETKLEDEAPGLQFNISGTKDTTIQENSELNEFVNKDESDILNTKEKAMETNQTDQVPTLNVSSEQVTNAKCEPENMTEAETKDEDALKMNVSKDLSDTAMVCDKLESSTCEENVTEESKEQQDSETNVNTLGENSITEDAQKTINENQIKSNIQDAEKIEEDKLLADPDDDKQTLVGNNDSSAEKKSTINGSPNSPAETKESKSDLENDSKTCDDCDDSNEKSNEAILQNEANSNNSVNSETTVLTESESSSEIKIQSGNLPKEDKNSMEPTIQTDTKEVESGGSEKRKFTEESFDNYSSKKPKLDNNICTRPKGVKKVCKGATFWPSNFRQKLCTCQECLTMYNDLSVLFLTDPEDTVSAYENLGKQKIIGEPATQYEKGLQALSSLDRIQQINALTEYNRMRDKLLDYLKGFKDKKEIVKEEDIKAFFADMKPKRETDGVYFCR